MLNRHYNNQVQIDDGSGGGDVGERGRWAGDVFANVGRANVRLFWRVTEAFSGDLSALIVTAQVCGGVGGGGGGIGFVSWRMGLREVEELTVVAARSRDGSYAFRWLPNPSI